MLRRNQSKFKEGVVDKLQIHGPDEEMRYDGEPTKKPRGKNFNLRILRWAKDHF